MLLTATSDEHSKFQLTSFILLKNIFNFYEWYFDNFNRCALAPNQMLFHLLITFYSSYYILQSPKFIRYCRPSIFPPSIVSQTNHCRTKWTSLIQFRRARHHRITPISVSNGQANYGAFAKILFNTPERIRTPPSFAKRGTTFNFREPKKNLFHNLSNSKHFPTLQPP